MLKGPSALIKNVLPVRQILDGIHCLHCLLVCGTVWSIWEQRSYYVFEDRIVSSLRRLGLLFVFFPDCASQLSLWTASVGVGRLCTECSTATGTWKCPTFCSARWTTCWLKNCTRPRARRTTWPTPSSSCKGTNLAHFISCPLLLRIIPDIQYFKLQHKLWSAQLIHGHSEF